MAKNSSLTNDFLKTHPLSAVKALENIDTAQAAAFLETVSVRLCASVVGKATPWIAAAWLEKLPLARTATLLQQMSYQEATSAVRLMTDTARDAVMKELPSGFAGSLRRSLTYPAGTVGAWMDQTVPTFPDDMTVADGRKFLKSRRGKPAQHLIVVGADKVFAGVVSANDLLRSPSTQPLKKTVDSSVRPLSNRASLASVLDAETWDRYTALPVTGSRGNVLGSLQRSDLKRGLEEIRAATPAPVADSMLLQLFGAYIAVLTGVTGLIADPGAAKPSTRP